MADLLNGVDMLLMVRKGIAHGKKIMLFIAMPKIITNT